MKVTFNLLVAGVMLFTGHPGMAALSFVRAVQASKARKAR